MEPPSDLWRRADAIFEEALDVEPALRLGFAARACGNDPALMALVTDLLRSSDEADQFFHSAASQLQVDVAQALTAEGDDEPVRPGDRLGAYRIVSLVAEGGMGAVYRAERAAGQFEQTVAIKVMRRGLLAGSYDRFLQERRILASLVHPNIARLYDGGVTDGGLPYLVMSYVAGVPITDYCDRARLSVDDRLTLFRDVCAAVAHAHQRLVIHRDLKPSNILVTPERLVKLLDFGIAKLIAEDAEDAASPRTLAGIQLLTPQYASPEQIRGESVTTASDVYSLGVLLHELLTGRLPYRLDARSRHDIERAVLETEPLAPSTVVRRALAPENGESPPSPDTLCEARNTTVKALRRRLRGDLDSIVLQALRKIPAERYATVDRLADDLRRWTEGLPISAGPPGRIYRMRKFVSRHPAGVSIACLLVVLGGLASLGAVWWARTAAAERDHSLRDAARDRAMQTFMLGLFASTNPNAATFAPLTAEGLLQRGEERLATDLTGQEDVQAAVMLELGKAYAALGKHQRAVPLLERALDINRRVSGPESTETADALYELALERQNLGAYDDAIELAQEALRIRRLRLGADHADVATTLNGLGLMNWNQGKYEQAKALHEESLAMRRRLFGETHVDVAESLNNLGLVLYAMDQSAAAEPLLREAVTLRKQLLGKDHPRVATALSNLGLSLWSQDKFDGAEQAYRESLDIRRKQLSQDNPAVANILVNLGSLLRNKGDLARARADVSEAVEIRRKVLGEKHPLFLTAREQLALIDRDRGEFATAERVMREVLDGRRAALGPEHLDVASSLADLGNLLRVKGEYAEAKVRLAECVRIKRKVRGSTSETTLTSTDDLARLLIEKGDGREAEALSRDLVLATEQPTGSGTRSYAARSRATLAYCLLSLNRQQEAEPLAREALRLWQVDMGGKEPAQIADAEAILGASLAAQGRLKEARPYLERSYAFLSKRFGGSAHALRQPLMRRIAGYLRSGD